MAGTNVKFDYLAITVNDTQISLYPVSFSDLAVNFSPSGLSIYTTNTNVNGFMIRDQSCYIKLFGILSKMQLEATTSIAGNMLPKTLGNMLGSVVIDRITSGGS